MIVYGSSLSPFVRKVIVFAAEKGQAIEVKPIGLGNADPEFREASPFGKMPGFRDGDFTISDSSAIVQYLEAVKPQPALIPSEARARARTIWWDEFADTILFACGVKMFFNRIVGPRFVGVPGDEAVALKAEKEELPPILDYLERVVPDSGFLVEDRLTLADIAVANPFVNLQHLNVGCGERPRLRRYVDAILARPSFAPLVESETRFLARTGDQASGQTARMSGVPASTTSSDRGAPRRA